MEGPIEPALERGIYSTFRQTNMTFRYGQIGTKLIDLDKLQLPNNSCLHIADNYLKEHITAEDIYPNLNDPLIVNETYKKYLEFILKLPSKDDPLFPITDTNYRFRPFNFNNDIKRYYSHHPEVSRVLSHDTLMAMKNILPIFNYNPILTAVLSGTFLYYRRFELLFKTILHMVNSIENKYQYLQFELSKTTYNKTAFVQTFNNISYQTVRIKNDQSFFLLIHLINFVSKTATTSLFSKLDIDKLDFINIVLTANNKAIIYNLGDLKKVLDDRTDNNLYLSVLKHVNTLKLMGYKNIDVTELNDSDYEKVVDDHSKEIESKDVVKDAQSVDNTNINTNNLPSSLDNNNTTLPSPSGRLPSSKVSTVSTKTTSSSVDKLQKTPGEVPKEVIPVDHQDLLNKTTPTVQNNTVPVVVIDNNKFTSVIDHNAQTLINSLETTTEEQKQHLLQIATKYKQLEINGVSVETLIDNSQDPDITTSPLNYLENKVVDKSMLHSTAIDLDKHYVQHMMNKDIATIVTSMVQHGMFLVDIQQEQEVTLLNRHMKYKMVYEDTQGRKHKVEFKLPIVSNDGTILVNGIESRMIKQQINLPICKIDNWRVGLSSNYNKTIVERITTKAHSFDAYISKYIASIYKAKVGLIINYGNFIYETKLPYDYTCLASRYSRLQFDETTLYFDYDNRESLILDKEFDLHKLEKKFGVLCGYLNDHKQYLFYGFDNQIRAVTIESNNFTVLGAITDIIFDRFKSDVTPPKQFSEWTELKILDKNFPIVYILGYEYGLKRTLDHIKLNYKFLSLDTKVDVDPTTIVIPFADGNLIFDRYPLDKSFIASGLLKFDTKSYPFTSFNTQDEYYKLLSDNGFSMNYLRGISAFFKYFIDPITRDVLMKMHEPITVAELLIRATQMLTTDEAIPASSMKNHRLRGYEQFTAILYNELYRNFSTYENKQGNRKVFSINPESVFQRILQDQTLRAVEETNPIENIKDKHAFTYSGSGGRTAESFVIEDRVFPKDGVGIISEATPDSGKVALNAYLVASPVIENIRGMYNTTASDNPKELTPSQIMSVSALLMPGATNDEPRRTNFISIQLKHHVPSQFSEVNRVRTGYESVVAHRTNEYYACVAKHDGIVDDVDSKLGIIKILYEIEKYPPLDIMKVSKENVVRDKFTEMALSALKKHLPVYIVQPDGNNLHFELNKIYSFNNYNLKISDIRPLDLTSFKFDYLDDKSKADLQKAKYPVVIKLNSVIGASNTDIFKFGIRFSNVSGSYLRQTIVANVKVGDHVKQGDVIAYNTGFFEVDQFDPKQVNWKHGIMANVALIEADTTIEDSNAITSEFSKRLQMQPAHVRVLQINNKTIVKDLVSVGDDVQTTDLLCTLEDADIGLLTQTDDSAMLDMMNALNRKSPKAQYHGLVEEIDVLYSCPIEDMHPSVQAIIKQINLKKSKLAKSAKDTDKYMDYVEPSMIQPGTKYRGIEFENDTIVFLIYISETIDHLPGDKSVLMGQCKTICSTVIPKPISTVSNFPLDMLFSARSVSNRILTSPLTIGFTNRVLMALEQDIVNSYFEENE